MRRYENHPFDQCRGATSRACSDPGTRSFRPVEPQIPTGPLLPPQALAVCDYLQKELVAGGKLISPNIATIHAAIKDGTHDLDCPYLWDDKPGYAGYPDSVAGMPEYLKAKIHAKKKNIGKSVSCKVVVGGCDGGTCG